MDYLNFKEEFLKELKRQMPDHLKLQEIELPKEDNRVHDALCIAKKDKSSELECAPTVYVKDFFNEHLAGDKISDIAGRAIDNALDFYNGESDKVARGFSDSVEQLKDKEKLKSLVYFDICSKDTAGKVQSEYTFHRFLDVVFGYRVDLNNSETGFEGTALVTQMLLKMAGLSEEELYEAALNNLRKESLMIRKMSEIVIESLYGDDLDEDRTISVDELVEFMTEKLKRFKNNKYVKIALEKNDARRLWSMAMQNISIRSIVGLAGQDVIGKWLVNRENEFIGEEEILRIKEVLHRNDQIFIIRTLGKAKGAAIVFADEVLKKICELKEVKRARFIFSSTNEILVFMDESVEDEIIKKMLLETNGEINRELVVSDSVYEYDYEKETYRILV